MLDLLRLERPFNPLQGKRQPRLLLVGQSGILLLNDHGQWIGPL